MFFQNSNKIKIYTNQAGESQGMYNVGVGRSYGLLWRANLAFFQQAVSCSALARLPSFSSLRKDFAVFSYDDLVERVRNIGVKD